MNTLPGQEAMVIRERYGARAVSHTLASVPIKAETLWAGMYDACHKMARVACARYREYDAGCRARGETPLLFADALDTLFPEPVPPTVYLACAIHSVLRDAWRGQQKAAEYETRSLSDPISAGGEGVLTLAERLAESFPERLPEAALLTQAAQREAAEMIGAVNAALGRLSEENRAALVGRVTRQGRRRLGESLPPATPQERQRLSRARGALRREVARLLGDRGREENTLFAAVCGERPRRPARRGPGTRKRAPEPWTAARQERLFQRLTAGGWIQRARARNRDRVEEAVVHELNAAASVPPPGPTFRAAVRVMDRYGVQTPAPQDAAAAQHWDRAREQRRAGKLEEAVAAFLACWKAEPAFVQARIAAAVTLFRLGRLDEARKIYLDILRRCPPGEFRCVAASNLSEIYLIWFRTGRGDKERHIGEAICCAQMGMARPGPARAANLLLAYAADRQFLQAEAFLADIFAARAAACAPEELLRLLSQIHDNDLIAFWSWMEEKTEENEEEIR